MNNDMESIGERLHTQDNKGTAEPIFCVQEKVRVHGFDPEFSDEYDWIFDGEIYEPDDPEAAVRNHEWDKYYYREHWQTVMVAFTKKGAQQYIDLNSHNHGGRELRIYVDTLWRCPEMIAVRAHLMGTDWNKSKEVKPPKTEPILAIWEDSIEYCKRTGRDSRNAIVKAVYDHAIKSWRMDGGNLVLSDPDFWKLTPRMPAGLEG